MNVSVLRFISLAWILAIMIYGYGVLSAALNLWPYPQLAEVAKFVIGDPEEKTTLKEKILNDAGIIPTRHIVEPAEKAYPEKKYKSLEDFPLNGKRQAPLVYMDEAAANGYRIIVGVFDFGEEIHGAVLLNENGDVENYWKISQEDVPWKHKPDSNVFPHGFEILKDGSILVAFDGGSSLTKYDYCGNVLWRKQGKFHHSIDLYDQESFWVWGSSSPKDQYRRNLIKMRTENGEVLRSFNVNEIIIANRDIDILGVHQKVNSESYEWEYDPFHQNDIDPLPSILAESYSKFDAEDLLISMRALNLVFVIDPDTLKVKWWRQGQVRRQHDPDWNSDGTITIFNNNMHRGYSNIIELDPNTLESKVVVDGRKYDFYTWMRGKHQLLPNGAILITASQQGRAFEVGIDGKVLFDFHNIYTEELGALAISEAYYLGLDYFKELPQCGE